MTVAELIEKLKELPPDAIVAVDDDFYTVELCDAGITTGITARDLHKDLLNHFFVCQGVAQCPPSLHALPIKKVVVL